MINAVEEFLLSLMIIIQRQDLMISWFDDNDDELFENTYVMFFESEFISNKIALKFLKHYIKNSDVDSDAEWKLMLMNNHESHIIFEFIAFANENHIRSFSLISHLTHCMQSLNVEIFQLYKHWHDQIIQNAVVTSFVKYSIGQFLNDLTKIRNNTFKSSIIRHVFEKFGMWSVNEKQCIKQLKHFVESYWLTKEWIANCCLSNLDEKFISLYKNSSSTISFTDFSSHDSSRFFWESRSSIVTRLFSFDQDVFEFRCHFDLISSESHTHFRALWFLDDFENQ
jgi:hypothetical protein